MLAGRQIGRGDDDIAIERRRWSGVTPRFADLRQSLHDVGRKLSLARRRRVEDHVDVQLVLRHQPLVDHLRHRLERAGGVGLLPEPAIGERDAGNGRDRAFAGDLLAGILLEPLDVAVVERRRGILARVEVGDQAIGLEPLDERVDLVERHFVVGDPAPRRVPAVEHEHGDVAVVGQQLGELALDQVDLGARDVEMPNVIAQVEDGKVKRDLEPFATKRIDVRPHHIDATWRVLDARHRRGGGPETEAVVVLGREAAPGHPRRLGRARPLIGVERGGMEHRRGIVRIAPLAVLEGGEVEVVEHAEAEVDKLLLQLQERLRLAIVRRGGLRTPAERRRPKAAAPAVAWRNSRRVGLGTLKCKRKIRSGEALSPLLLLRDSPNGRLIIADGYHRLCAVYSFDEDAVIPCKIC